MEDLKVARFTPPPERLISFYVSPPSSSTGDLYILPSCHSHPPLHGYTFNFMTGSFRKIKPPLSSKQFGSVVNPERPFYFNTVPRRDPNNIDFECYNPDQNSWKATKPSTNGLKLRSPVLATVVLGDFILFNLESHAIWAYDVTINKWYHVDVDVDDEACYSIVGNPVFVQDTDTIYALSYGNRVLALSFRKIVGIDGDHVFKCSLSSEISVPGSGMDPIFDDYEILWWPTRDLFHLGRQSFCLVQTCMIEGSRENLFIKLTYMKLTGEKMVTLMERCHNLKIQDWESIEVVQCFLLPDCKATAFKGGKPFDFEFDPHEVHSVFVRNLPRHATVAQVEKGLDVFGPIVRDGIQVQSEKCSAYVEFEGADSMQRAIEAKKVYIGGCLAEIYDRSWEMKNQPNTSGQQKDSTHTVGYGTEPPINKEPLTLGHSGFTSERDMFIFLLNKQLQLEV